MMIVDDYVPFRRAVKDMLSEQLSSAKIVEAGNSQEVLRQLTPFPPDLVFMDIRLGHENGLTLTRMIKANYPDTTVAILTSYDLPQYREAAIQSGASGYIYKSSVELGGISTMGKCFEKAKNEGRQKPICVRLATECPSKG